MTRYQQGRFVPNHPEKYCGDIHNIIYRSSWEFSVLRRLDNDPRVISYSSEELVIPYHDRATGKLRRYFPDFVIKKIGPDNKIEIIVIEIKPYSQSVPPERGKKTDRRYLQECKTFATNFSKWESAARFCKQKGWRFIIITERELGR